MTRSTPSLSWHTPIKGTTWGWYPTRICKQQRPREKRDPYASCSQAKGMHTPQAELTTYHDSQFLLQLASSCVMATAGTVAGVGERFHGHGTAPPRCLVHHTVAATANLALDVKLVARDPIERGRRRGNIAKAGVGGVSPRFDTFAAARVVVYKRRRRRWCQLHTRATV